MVAEQSIQKFNLYDVLPIAKTSSGRKVLDKKDIDFIKMEIDDIERIFKIYKDHKLEGDFTSSNEKLLEQSIKRINERRKEYFFRNYKLHKDILESVTSFSLSWTDKNLEIRKSRDILSKLSETPTIQIGDIKSLADKLDMIVFPFEYIDKNSYDSEGYEKRHSIQRFYRELKDDFDLVVLAPINHYSLTSHAKAEDANKGIYAGKHSMIFTSVLMNIPMFRSILNDLEDLRENVESLSGTISNVQQNMEMMQQQINNLQKQLDQQRERQLQIEMKQENEIKSMSKKLSDLTFRVTDPVIFAIPKGLDINDMNIDNGNAFVGPVWGPDFDGVALFNLDLEIIKNQRNQLNQIVERIW